MKLKCDKHGRRVLSGKTSFLHRTGDMSKCDSKIAALVDNTSKTTRSFKLDGQGGLIAVATRKQHAGQVSSTEIDLTRYTRPDTRSYEEATAPIDLETGLPIKE
jgi:hypothetical protein